MTAQYHIDPTRICLDRFQKSLASRELIPSRAVLKNSLKKRFGILRSIGIHNLGELIIQLKSKPKIEALSKKTGLSTEYLTLLRREANSYFPNPVPLSKFSGFDKSLIRKLGELGIKNSKQLFEKAADNRARKMLSSESGVPIEDLNELFHLSDLSRLYGVGPVFARMLYDIGIDSAAAFVRHSPEEIVDIYEDQTKKKADFTASDIEFSLEIAIALSTGLDRSESSN